MLRSLLSHTARVVQQLPAHSSRNETLSWLYTSVMWHLLGSEMVHNYIGHLLMPQLVNTHISGIHGISQVIVHRDGSTGEWYMSTSGSNFSALYALPGPGQKRLYIHRGRCQSTNIQEVHACLGLEAVCWLFSNGTLARSLGVNGAACRLLVDHMASRGLWRGVNRTSILSGSGTLNNITVEDPTHRPTVGIFFSGTGGRHQTPAPRGILGGERRSTRQLCQCPHRRSGVLWNSRVHRAAGH
jgi:hypothetical protein